jgi:prepilin-type N-terminal cleavage/methylation domain-containing protein/prepilin-type processing-associated H-X9-DG protein
MRAAHARTAFTLVELLVVIAVIGILVGLLLPAVQSAREAARRMQCQNNLKQIGLAIMNYESANRRLPMGWNGMHDPMQGTTYRWSFLAAILPYLEQGNLHDDLNLSRTLYPPGGGQPPRPEHVPMISTIISTYLCPSDHGNPVTGPSGVMDSAPTNYSSCFGSGMNNVQDPSDVGHFDQAANGMFSSGAWRRLADCLDGLSNTALVSESLLGPGGPDAANDSRPDPRTHMALVVPFALVSATNCDQPVPGGVNRFVASRGRLWAGQSFENSAYNHFFPPNTERYDCFFWVNRGLKAARSRHPGGVQVLFGDGSVHFVSNTVELAIWRAIGTRDQGEVVAQFR